MTETTTTMASHSQSDNQTMISFVDNDTHIVVDKCQISDRQMSQIVRQQIKVSLVEVTMHNFILPSPPSLSASGRPSTRRSNTQNINKDLDKSIHIETKDIKKEDIKKEDIKKEEFIREITDLNKLHDKSPINCKLISDKKMEELKSVFPSPTKCETKVETKQEIEEKEKPKQIDKRKTRSRSDSLASNTSNSTIKKFKCQKSNIENKVKNEVNKKNKENKSKQCNAKFSRLIGLPNMGNTCYINSIIQVLRITPGFKQFICKLNKEMNRNKTSDKLKPSDKHLIEAIHDIFKTFGDNMANDFDISSNETQISKLVDSENIRDRFESGTQQDCHEFLNWLINELNCYAELLFGKINKNGYQLRANVKNSNLTTFESFRGLMLRTIRCNECEYSSVQKDWFEDIQIPLCDSEEISDIHDLNSFSDLIHRKDYLKDDNMFDCFKCSKKTNASVVNSIKTPPKVLIIYIKKTSIYQMLTRNTKPLKKLFKASKRLEYSSDGKTFRYNLYALVMHSGSDVNNGHYYAVIDTTARCPSNTVNKECKCSINAVLDSGWIRVNDHKVSKVTDNYINKLLEDESINSTPYLAFYHQIDN